jgi:predicted nucleotidyltransferase
MNREAVIQTLRQHKDALNSHGVAHAALFGSVSRGEEHSGSDIDIMIDLNPEAHLSVFDYFDLKEYIASLFEGPVDVVNREGLKPYVRPAAMLDVVYAF